jgi:hypothetical protein
MLFQSIYTPELAARVLEAVARTGSLRAACREIGIDRGTVMNWVVNDVEGFAQPYARAKEEGIDGLVEETLEIADEKPGLTVTGTVDGGSVAHARLRIDSRHWLAERCMAKRYGVKQGIDHTSSDGSITIATGVPRADHQ